MGIHLSVPPLCVFHLLLFGSFFFVFLFSVSVCLTQLIIQMSTARSLPSKGVSGMFSTVPFLYVMWNQSPQTAEISSVNSTHCCSANKRKINNCSERLIVDHKKEKKVILIITISFVTITLCLPPFLPSSAITTLLWQARNNQRNDYYHNHHHHHCHRRLCHVFARLCYRPVKDHDLPSESGLVFDCH